MGDIDSPPPTQTMMSTSASLSMSLSNPMKLEMGDIFDTSEADMNNQTDPSKPKSGRDISPSVVKLNKVENMTGFEKLRDGRPSIKVPSNNQNIKQEVKQEIKQEFIPDPNSMVVSIAPPEQTHLEDSQHHHSSSKKHKKEKKSKKDKKEKREKSERYSLNSNGEMVKTKHRHKHKDKDREHATASSSSSSGLKLKIKPVVPIPPASSAAVDSTGTLGTGGQQDIKIKLCVPPNPNSGGHQHRLQRCLE